MFGVLYLRKVTYHELEAKRGKQINICKAAQVGTRRIPCNTDGGKMPSEYRIQIFETRCFGTLTTLAPAANFWGILLNQGMGKGVFE